MKFTERIRHGLKTGLPRYLVLTLILAMAPVFANAQTNDPSPYCEFGVQDPNGSAPCPVNEFRIGPDQDNLREMVPFNAPDFAPWVSYQFQNHLEPVELIRSNSYYADWIVGIWDWADGDWNAYVPVFQIYLDMDQDESFDEDELIYDWSYNWNEYQNGTYRWAVEGNASISIPTDALTGATRMRVISETVLDYPDMSPCGSNAVVNGNGYDIPVYILKGNDASPIAMGIDGDPSKFGPGPQDVYVTVKNRGTNPLSSVNINWWVDGTAQTIMQWSDTENPIPSGGERKIIIGSYDFQLKDNMDTYEMYAMTSSPNNTTDEETSNDRYPLTNGEYVSLAPAIVPGNYTISSATGNFPNFTSAVEYMQNYGIFSDGQVMFEVFDGTYTEQFDITGIDHDNNSLVFQSRFGPDNCILQNWNTDPGSNFIVNINQPELGVTFTGFTFNIMEGEGWPPYGRIINVENGLNMLHLMDNAFSGVPLDIDQQMGVIPSPNGVVDVNKDFALVNVMGNQIGEFIVENNTFWYGSYGISYETAGGPESTIDVSENEFRGTSEICVFLHNDETMSNSTQWVYHNQFRAYQQYAPFGAVWATGTAIFGNDINGLVGTAWGQSAISVMHDGAVNHEEAIVVDNSISNCTDVNGIYADVPNTNRVEISYNSISNLEVSLYDSKGIVLMNAEDVDTRALVHRNMIGEMENNIYGVQGGTGLDIQYSLIEATYNYVYVYGTLYGYDTPAVSIMNSEGEFATNMVVTNYNGVRVSGNYHFGMYYNSIHTWGSDNAALVLGEYVDNVDGTDDNFKKEGSPSTLKHHTDNVFMRNLFINSAGGNAIWVDYSFSGEIQSDYNDIYPEMIGGEHNYNSWKMDYDQNSVSIMPAFKENYDLHQIQVNEDLYLTYPLGFNFDEEPFADFESMDWDGETRSLSFYYGVDNLFPQVEIVQEPESITDCFGTQNHQFTAVATATLGAEAEYQWMFNGEDIPGETEAILYLDDLNYDMSGVYQCRIKAAGGSDFKLTDEVLLYVYTDPEITRPPMTKTAPMGGRVMFEVQAHINGDYPLENVPTVQWKVNGNPMVNDDRIAGAQSSILSIVDLQSSDFGQEYTVELTGKCGIVESDPFTINEGVDLQFTMQPADVVVCEGESATFSVDYTNSGTVSAVQWMQDGMPVTGGTNKVLVIDPVAMDDAGSYYVEVTVQPGDLKFTSEMAGLTVNPLPMITTQPEDQTVESGKELTLTIEADYADTYQWFKDGAPLSDPSATTSMFTKASATMSDAGTYYCVVGNDCGTVQSNDAEVTIQLAGQFTSVENAQAGGYALLNNSPNPVESETTIEFVAPQASEVKITLTDQLGNEVARIFDGTAIKGMNRVEFDSAAVNLTSGVYYYTMTAGGFTQTKSMVIVK